MLFVDFKQVLPTVSFLQKKLEKLFDKSSSKL